MDETQVVSMDESLVTAMPTANREKAPEDEGIDVTSAIDVGGEAEQPKLSADPEGQMLNGVIRTLDGEIAGDEFAGDAVNYQILLGKIDALLDRLRLDA